MQKAYTLIELLIVMSIIGLMLAVGVPSYAYYGKQMEFKQTVNQIAGLYQSAYNYSKNPTNTEGVANIDIVAYRVAESANDDGTQYFQLKQSIKLIPDPENEDDWINMSATGDTSNKTKIDLPTKDDLVTCAGGTVSATCPKIICYTDTTKKCEATTDNTKITLSGSVEKTLTITGVKISGSSTDDGQKFGVSVIDLTR